MGGGLDFNSDPPLATVCSLAEPTLLGLLADNLVRLSFH